MLNQINIIQFLFFSGIDDIVLSYMISVLETLGMEQDEANFDACEFSEVMSAYMPGFSEIDR